MKYNKQILTWLIFGYVLTILVFSIAMINTKTSLNKTYVLSLRSDYLLHALQFVPWMVLIYWRWREKRGVGFFALALGAGLVLTVISEGVQYWLPYRAFNLVDLLSNFVGVVVGALIVGWGSAKRYKSKVLSCKF